MAFQFEAWPSEFRVINQVFGANPDFYGRFGLPGHEGLDIKALLNTRIFTVASGKVTKVHNNPNTHNYGNHVRVDHGDGFTTTYAHLQRIDVQLNQQLSGGQQVGLAGSTGNSTGPHLHLTLKQQGNTSSGFPYNILDPSPFLLPLLGWQEPAGPYTEGFAFTGALLKIGDLAQATAGGVSLRQQPQRGATRIAVIPEGTITIVNGPVQGEYTPVLVASVAIGVAPTTQTKPADPPAETMAIVDGWAFSTGITVMGNQALAGDFGINLRATPSRNGALIGLVKGGSTMQISGSNSGEYTPVSVARNLFAGVVNLPEAPPEMPEDSSSTEIPADSVLGWGSTQFMRVNGRSAQITASAGLNIRNQPSANGSTVLGIAKELATVTVAGLAQGGFTPVLVRQSDMVNLISPLPAVTQPEPLPASMTLPTDPEGHPIEGTTAGWALTAQIKLGENDIATVGQFGLNLRAEARRDAASVGMVQAGTDLLVCGVARGEFTPVRIMDSKLQAPMDKRTMATAMSMSSPDVAPVYDPDPPLINMAQLGVRLPTVIDDAVMQTCELFRPGMLRIPSSLDDETIQKLIEQHPNTAWVVALENVTAIDDVSGFINNHIDELDRVTELLLGRDVVLELVSQPDISDARTFANQWVALVEALRIELPNGRYLFPPLTNPSAEQWEAMTEAVNVSDGIATDLIWSNEAEKEAGIEALNQLVQRFQRAQVWVTEAGFTKEQPVNDRADAYLDLWMTLRQWHQVQGLTFTLVDGLGQAFDMR